MSDPFLTLEGSAQSSRVVEFYDIVLSNGTTYRIASGNRDLLYGGNLYKASTIERDEIKPTQVSGNSGDDGLSITLPVNHAIVNRWFAMASPPETTLVTCWRKQEASLVAERQWVGLASGIDCSGSYAKLLIPSRTSAAMVKVLPTLQASTSCQHVLYGPACRADRSLFVVSAMAIRVDGRVVHVDLGSTDKNGDWSEIGELVHVPTGQRMTIAKQTDTAPGVEGFADLQLDQPIVELKAGDAVLVYAGCKKSIAVCETKYSNRDNFGGFPNMPSKNPSVPTMLGTGQ